MTIRDIKIFLDIVDFRTSLGLPLDKSILLEFTNKTKHYNYLFSSGIDFIHEFFKFNKDYVPKNISETIIDFINNNQKIKNLSIKFANHGSL